VALRPEVERARRQRVGDVLGDLHVRARRRGCRPGEDGAVQLRLVAELAVDSRVGGCVVRTAGNGEPGSLTSSDGL